MSQRIRQPRAFRVQARFGLLRRLTYMDLPTTTTDRHGHRKHHIPSCKPGRYPHHRRPGQSRLSRWRGAWLDERSGHRRRQLNLLTGNRGAAGSPVLCRPGHAFEFRLQACVHLHRQGAEVYPGILTIDLLLQNRGLGKKTHAKGRKLYPRALGWNGNIHDPCQPRSGID